MAENPYKSPQTRGNPVPRWRTLFNFAWITLSILFVITVVVVILALLFAPADFFRRS